MTYLQAGGSIYIEGVEIGYYHATGQLYDSGLWGYLGSLYLGDGNATGNVSQLHGQNMWFGAGMLFGYPYGQTPDTWVDILGPAGVGSGLQFVDQLNQGRIVSYQPPGQTYRTITSGVCFCAFSENAPMSTQQRLMARLVGFMVGEDAIPPGAIASVEAQLAGTTMTLSWTPVTQDAQGDPEHLDCYLVERGISAAGPWTAVGIPVNASYSGQAPGAGDPDLHSFYRIRALDATGNLGAAALAAEFEFAIDHP
ncbi:MAG: hypothetical protein MUE60_02930 [Candidatus Eisenbacteria bacterium]|nr:hypothetical protein [Candidatus Eisenbacteria bacterium]